MSMEMSLNQKIEWVKDLLSGQYSLWDRDTFYIPVTDIPDNITGHFWEILQKFERDGLVKKAHLGYAGLFDAEHKPEIFEKIGDDGKIPTVTFEDGNGKAKTKKLFPTYYVKIDAAKLNGSSSKSPKEEVKFDALAGELSYGKKVLAFRGTKDKLRLRLFKAVWDEKCVVKKGKTIIKGMALPLGTVAARMELVDSSRDYERSADIKDKLSRLIKNTKTTLRLNELPVTIRKQNGVQIVVDIK